MAKMVEQHLAQLTARADWQDPIVIVGAGPVGMSAALGLAHYGIPSLLLDDGEGPAVEGSRAIFMERHTLEILGTWSPVGRQMAELGMTLVGGRVFFRKTELYKTLNAPPEPDTRYPRFVNMPQNLLEHLQYEALQQTRCCEVCWQHKVVGITQNDEAATVEVETPQGKQYFSSPYVLAADGPRSTLRHLLNLNFPGESRSHHFLILDVRMQLETPRERWFWFDPPFNPGRTALLHPQPDSIYRIDYQLPPHEDLEAAKQPESLHKRIIATVGERPYEIVWKSIYTYQQRALEHFKHRRVLFLGDAAHLMSPFGGRGLNSGVQDVSNLVWKLALVRAGLAPVALLDTYHDERHAAALENLRLHCRHDELPGTHSRLCKFEARHHPAFKSSFQIHAALRQRGPYVQPLHLSSFIHRSGRPLPVHAHAFINFHQRTTYPVKTVSSKPCRWLISTCYRASRRAGQRSRVPARPLRAWFYGPLLLQQRGRRQCSTAKSTC